LTFEIGRNYIKLIEQIEPEFKDLVDKPLSPGILFLELQKCGINLLPIDDDTKLAGLHVKNGQSEENAIIDIATCLRSFAFRSCKWNKSISDENIVVKIRENLEYDREYFEDHEPDWKYVMWWPNKCAFVRTSDDAEEADTRIV
jgi:cancer susceptibility candidate protein 1